MPRISPPIVSFNGGELSPRLYGRTDINKYASGCRTMKNFVPLVHGPAVRRPGTLFVADAKCFYQDESRLTPNIRLIPFIFSATDSYMLEFGDQYVRFYKNHEQILTSQDVSNCADNGSGLIRVTTAAAHGLMDDDIVTITGVQGCTEANGTWRIDVIDSTNFDLLGSSYVNTYTSGGSISSPYQITSPYDDEDLPLLKYVQEADTMYIVHPDYPPKQLVRLSDTSWTLDNVSFRYGPWMDANSFEEVGDNLCVNGDMELDANWTSVGTPTINERSSEQHYHGSYSRKFSVDAAYEGIRSDLFTTTTDKLYVIRCRVYTSTGKFRIEYRNGSGATTTARDWSDVPVNEWKEYEVFFKETAGGSQAYVSFQSSSATTGTWYVDQAEVYEIDTIVMACSVNSGSGTLTSSSDYFESDHVGSLFRLDYGDQWGIAQVTSYTSATSVSVNVIKRIPEAGIATVYWREGAFSAKRGYPNAIAFHEQSLWLAGTWAEPQTVWRSVVGQYTNFEPGTNASDSLKYKIASDQVQYIQWMASMNNLIIGTTNGEWRLGPQDADDPIKPDNIKITQQSAYGSANMQPINLRNAILFVQRLGDPANKGTRVRELSYRYDLDGYVGVDLSLLADHIAEYGIVDWAYQPNPHPIVWCFTRNGQLLGLTYEKDQEVYAWHKHELGGSGKVISLAIKPGTYQDELWMVVQRTINGQDVQYIEYMDDFDWAAYLKTPGVSDDGTRQSRMYFVDCGKKVIGGSTTSTFTGLDHLIGETVQILAGGAQYPDAVVDSEGSVTISGEESSWCVGLGYESDLEPLGLVMQTDEGTTAGKRKRIHEVAVKFYETLGGWVGPDEDNLDEIITRTTESVGSPPNLFTGDYTMAFPGGYTTSAGILVRQNKPFPMTVICLMPRWSFEDR